MSAGLAIAGAALRPLRLRRSRAQGFDLARVSREANGLPVVIATRPTILGNPFVHPDPVEAVGAYRRLCGGTTEVFTMSPGGLAFAANAHPRTIHWAFAAWLRADGLARLRGHNLACWCALCPAHAGGKPLGETCAACKPCHVDVLGEILCEAVDA